MEPLAPEDVVFGNTVDALFSRGLGGLLTPRCHELLLEHGFDMRSKLKPYYPRLRYYACLKAVAKELFPQLSQDAALFELGKLFMKGFDQTLIGKATLTAVRWMGPERTLAKMNESFRSSNNYMHTELKKVAPGHVELTLSQTSGAPSYFEGVLTTGLGIAGAQELTIERAHDDGTRCTLVLRWKS